MSVPIKGIQKISLIDYPEKMCCIVFLPRCNFKCPYCQNPDLINNHDSIPDVPEQEFFDLLKKRKKWLDGVVITGGEPTLHKDLVKFCKKIKEHDYLIKLDTNGTNPIMLKELISKKLVDYIAMDIKAGKNNYDKLANVKVNMNNIQKSIDLIKNSGIDYEFRSTLVPGLFSKKDANDIAVWLKGTRCFSIQQFRNTMDLLDKSYKNIKPYSKKELKDFKRILEKGIDKVDVRG